MLTFEERVGGEITKYNMLMQNIRSSMRVAIPAIVVSFDAVEQTISAKPTIKEKVMNADNKIEELELPILLDVPIVIPQAGGYCITFPVKAGDECLIIFADMCIDAWWSNGGVQNQIEMRRHDLSDGFAILGVSSQPKVITDYSTTSMQIRNAAHTDYIEISEDGINLVGTIKINGEPYEGGT